MSHHRIWATLLTVWTALAADPLYRSPSAIVADPQGKTLYISEYTAKRIAVFDIASGRVTKEIALPASPGGLALSADNQRIYVAGASPDGKIFAVDLPSGRIGAELRAGHTPVALVLDPARRRLYVCNQFNDTVSVIDLASGREKAVIRVVRQPVDAGLTPDGKLLVVANLLPAGPADVDYVAARVSIIDTQALRVVREVSLPSGSSAVHALCLSPDGRYAYAVHTRGHFQLATIQLDRGWMNTNVLSVIDLARGQVVKTVVLDEIDHGAANPRDVAITGDGRYLVVAHAGTHELSVIDRAALHKKMQGATGFGMRPERRSVFRTALAPPDFDYLKGMRRRIPLAGVGPRALALVGTTAYAAEYFSDSIGVVDISPDAGTKPRSLPLGKLAPPTPERRGELLFHDASFSFQNWQSCSTCHTGEARVDGLNWDLLNDGLDNPKNAKSLLLAHQTPPAMITGVRARAEIAVRSGFKYILFVNRPEADAEAVDAYLKSLKPVPSPYLVDGQLGAAARRGRKVFETAGCSACHPLPLGTNLKKSNVGTGRGAEKDTEFDTPTLIEVWRTAPYLHDGRARSIREVLTKYNQDDAHGLTSNLTRQQLDDLIEYVLSL